MQIRIPYVMFALLAVAGLALLAFLSLGRSTTEPAQAADPDTPEQISLRAKGNIDCDSDGQSDGATPVPQPLTPCFAPVLGDDPAAEDMFTITVDADVIPSGGYSGFGAEIVGPCSQFLVDLGSLTIHPGFDPAPGSGWEPQDGCPPGLTWNPRAIDAENDPDVFGPPPPQAERPADWIEIPFPDGIPDPDPIDGDSCLAEVVWPDLSPELCSAFIGELGQRRLGGTTASSFPEFTKSNYSETLVELDVHCNAAGTYTIWLTAQDAGGTVAPFGAAYIDRGLSPVLVKTVGSEELNLDGFGTEAVPIAASLEINCGGVAGEATPTVAATPTEGPSPTPGGPTPTTGPTNAPTPPSGTTPPGATATPCPATCPEITLDAIGGDVTCDDAADPNKCTVDIPPGAPVDVAFTLTLNASELPEGGYGGFTADVFFGGLRYDQQTCTNEIVWPDEFLCIGFDGPGGQRQLRAATGLFGPLPKSNFSGPLVELDLRCPRLGQFVVTLVAAPSTPLGASYIDLNGAPVALASPGQQPVDVDGDTIPEMVDAADALLINCFPPHEYGDVDGDGVVTAADGTLLLWFIAGLWDDVPAPLNLDANGDGVVNAVDVTLVFQFTTGLIRALGPPQPGDVNNDGLTDGMDGLWTLWYISDLVVNVPNRAAMDVNEDGVVNAEDVTLILQLGASLIDSASLSS